MRHEFYECMRWAVHPKHTEAEVVAACEYIYECVGEEAWIEFGRRTTQPDQWNANWAHWVCRVHTRTVEDGHCPAEVRVIVRQMMHLLKTVLSRSSAPVDWTKKHTLKEQIGVSKNGKPKYKKTKLGSTEGIGKLVRTYYRKDWEGTGTKV